MWALARIPGNGFEQLWWAKVTGVMNPISPQRGTQTQGGVGEGLCSTFCSLHFGIPKGELLDFTCKVSVEWEPWGTNTGSLV